MLLHVNHCPSEVESGYTAYCPSTTCALTITGVLVVQIYSQYPNSTDNLLLMGAAHYHLGNFQQSAQCNDVCILLDPQIAEAHANLANSLQQLGHLPMAALYYQVRFFCPHRCRVLLLC